MAEGGIPSADPDISITNRTGGGFRGRIEDVNEICISDFYNPWNFYSLFLQGDSFVVNWCVRNGLLPDRIPCTAKGNCDGVMKLSQRSGRVTGYTLRCMKNRNHECASRKYSFFENSKLTIQDVMVFVKTYLEGNTLYRCSRMCGVHYQSTGVDWGSFVRELFKEHFMRHILTRKISGEVEIDESLFGRRVKHHRGNPRKGCKIWVFGMVERSSNTVILYPVRDRSQRTLLPLIQRHVEKGATIFSDGWSAYCSLNEAGYSHFTVIHKHTFKSQYRNLETGDTITVHTNRIEGAWKHANDHFKTIVGTKLSQFEGHLAEVMWGSDVKEGGAIFTMTPSNTLADGISFAVNSTASLTCTNQPYAGSQIWIFDSVEVAECGLILCVENMSNPSRFSFMNNISAGIFVFDIDHVLKTDDTKVIDCSDRTVPATISFTLNVEVSGEGGTTSDGLSAGEITGIVIGVLVIVVIVCIVCFYFTYKRQKQQEYLKEGVDYQLEMHSKNEDRESNGVRTPFLSSGSLTITASNTWDGGTSFKAGSMANLTVQQQQYSGTHNWSVDSVTVQECIFRSCEVKNASDKIRYSFKCDTTSGFFAFTINPVEKTDNGKVIGCYDGTITGNLTLNVTDESKEESYEGTSDFMPTLLLPSKVTTHITIIIMSATLIIMIVICVVTLPKYRKMKQQRARTGNKCNQQENQPLKDVPVIP